jgi:multiple sugar transport system substrate-binding protein
MEPLAVSNGFKFNDGLYATKYYYDDPKFAETIQWYANLNLVDGVAPALADIKSLGANALFTGGKGALTTDGSWMIGAYTKDTKFKVGFARLPKGSRRSQVDVQRSRRLNLGWQQAPRTSLAMGEVRFITSL